MRSKNNLFLKKIGSTLLVLVIFLSWVTSVSAASNIEEGIAQVDQTIALSATSPIVIALRIIQVALGVLGVIAVSLIIYAGFLWMTSAGSDEKINQAKRILRQTVIGLIIILSSWGITYFILEKLVGVTGGGSGQESISGRTPGGFGLSALGSCSLETVFPEPNSKDNARNTTVLITAKEPINLETICYNDRNETCACNNTPSCNRLNFNNIQIFNTASGNACVNNNCAGNVNEVEVSVPGDGKTLVLRPLKPLGSPDGYTEYSVRLNSAIEKKLNKESLFASCSADYFEWTFEVSNKLDLTPPQVKLGGNFPPADPTADLFEIKTKAQSAQAKITVNSCPRSYQTASGSISALGSAVAATLEVNDEYSGVITDFTVQVKNGQMQLFSGNSSLGVSPIVDGKATFAGYFTISPESVIEGNSWSLRITPVRPADSITVVNKTYIFVDKKSGAGNEIVLPEVCAPLAVTEQIVLALSGNENVNVSSSANQITLFFKKPGIFGNSQLLATNSEALSLTPFSGGVDKNETYTIRGLKDQPMNTVVRVDFNEPVNPTVLSGQADEVAPFVRLVNADPQALPAGHNCGAPKDCLSYNCETSVCVGDYISGNFSLTNNYQTLEFLSNRECGVNSCGEKIYCLPANSHLALRLEAANLQACQAHSDCQPLTPYSQCEPLANVCRDNAAGRNYPQANPLNLDGVVDLAFNSLDGNRDGRADGRPQGVYNYFIEGANDFSKRDGFEFSFFINGEINLAPPKISLASPRLAESGVLTTRPVVVDFNDLMMARTLATGVIALNNGLSVTEHKLINLDSSVAGPLGYWLKNENKEIGNPDGQPDYTSLRIEHTDFFEAVTYITQIGSGVKNIYQNCFKPSVGPACLSLTEENPSCCFGSETNRLDASGNCIR